MASETYNRDTENVECPYCGYRNKLTDLYNDLQGPEDAETDCYDCGKTYRASFHISISVTARTIDVARR